MRTIGDEMSKVENGGDGGSAETLIRPTESTEAAPSDNGEPEGEAVDAGGDAGGEEE